jgi:hypothetical protein
LRIWKLPGPVVRVAIILVLVLAALLFLRQQFVPETFGELGHYRTVAVTMNADLPVRYAGLQLCVECHDEESEVKRSSFHRGLTCEGCHGPSAIHASDPAEALPLIPRERTMCLRCHEYRFSRPTGFPQIIAELHNPMEPCLDCHDPHDPTPPEVPGECSACHAAIARTKAVSHHFSISCETCHETADEHRVDPRSSLPTKPRTREFCARCHARGADSPVSIPRIELVEHGGRYVCWQCHYPHFPEAY